MTSCHKILVYLLLTSFFSGVPALTFADPVALNRLLGKNSTGHLYTIDCQGAVNASKLHYTYEGIAAYIEPTQTAETTPLYELWKPNSHFYTADSNERRKLVNAGYTNEGVVGYIRTQGDSNTVALYRSFNQKSGDRLYTIDRTEHDTAQRQHGYTDEGIVGYVWPDGKKCSGLLSPSPTAR